MLRGHLTAIDRPPDSCELASRTTKPYSGPITRGNTSTRSRSAAIPTGSTRSWSRSPAASALPCSQLRRHCLCQTGADPDTPEPDRGDRHPVADLPRRAAPSRPPPAAGRSPEATGCRTLNALAADIEINVATVTGVITARGRRERRKEKLANAGNAKGQLNELAFLKMAGAAGLEPATIGFGDRCSTNWNYAPATNEA